MCGVELRFHKHSYTLFFDLQGAHSAHFAQRALCTSFQTFLFLKIESCNFVCRREFGSWKTGAKCVLCSAKCALCSSVRSDLTTRFKRPREKKLLLRVSLKLLKN